MNKPRLIDANELIEVVKNIQNHMKEVNEKPVPVDAREIFSLFVEMIDCQPTAYDIDKVVERLEELETYKQTVTMEKHPFCASEIETVSKKKAVEIVKGNYSENPNSSECIVDVNKTSETVRNE